MSLPFRSRTGARGLTASAVMAVLLACTSASHEDLVCPLDQPAQGESCASADSGALNCSFGVTCCTCVYGSFACSNSDQVWQCQETVAPAPCPTTLPATGAACSGREICSYCTGQGYFTATCDGGTFFVEAFQSSCGG